MPTSKRIGQLAATEAMETPRPHFVSESASGLPWTERQYEALVKVVPDQLLLIKLHEDGSISITGDRICFHFAADALSNPRGQHAAKDKPGLTSHLCQELACQAKGLMNECLRSGEVQILGLHIDHDEQTSYYQIRAVACGTGEILSLARDITTQEEADGDRAGDRELSARLNKALQNEAVLRPEDEQMLRDISTRMNCLLEDTIETIQSIVQKRDPITAGHQARVWKLACAIGRQMDLGKTQVDVIGLAALLHDFGKVFIPANILNKPGKLTDAEYTAVKNHAEAVFQILNTIDLFCPIADIVHQHHERMDGSGYPLGLKGEDILIEARIIAVADVVEAMLSDRPYRPALGVEAAMKEIAAGRGKLYDAHAVDACTALFRDGKFEFDVESGFPARTSAPGA